MKNRVMAPDTTVSMRRTKLKAEEAALIAGEVVKPSWESRNEGIHERVSFEDTLWGFELAGGAYYRTPLRVTYVKPDSRAEKAGIRLGDKLLKINGEDTSSMTIQEAHQRILDAGIFLRLAVTSPDDITDAFYYYEDPIVEDPEIEKKRLLEEEKARERERRTRVSSHWSLQWPWVSKRKIMYRESNCFMVPSKYEKKHIDRFPKQPSQKYQEGVVLHSAKSSWNPPRQDQKTNDQDDSVESAKEVINDNRSVVNDDINNVDSKYDNIKFDNNDKIQKFDVIDKEKQLNDSSLQNKEEENVLDSVLKEEHIETNNER